ncbi:hypothetical protein PCASD_21757 [Puccinia coronata f. sp. avenae]|uniref:Uncharacterized protein n=1 Tax=Puccinia coronata f. sp. avenae TaxID=200324 RepID=A0A2N5TWV3_9BASI|nr:hypothetical protein PCASD_21757 [Puccinia coronata f. sp. avenae]
MAKVLPSPNPFMEWAAHGRPCGPEPGGHPWDAHGLLVGLSTQAPTGLWTYGLPPPATQPPARPLSGNWPDGRPWAAQPSPLTATGRSGQAIFLFFPQMAAQTRPKPDRVWEARWAPCPIAILTWKEMEQRNE